MDNNNLREEPMDTSTESSARSSAQVMETPRRAQSVESTDSSVSVESRAGSSTQLLDTPRRVRWDRRRPSETTTSDLQSEEEESFSDSELDEKDDDDEGFKVEGSIHRLCINKLLQLFSPRNPDATEEEMIKKLVEKFNNRKKENTTRVFAGDFKLEPNKTLSDNPGSVDLLCQKLPENNFQIRLYVSQRHRRVPPILKYHGSNRKCGPIHLCWFFYRPGEIFALTTSQGFRLVHDHSEFDFPNKIAARLCTDKGFKIRKKRLLVGQDWEEAKTSKTSERPSMGDFPSLYSTFTCELRHSASIRSVTKLSPSSKNVDFKACSVRFASKLNIFDLPKIFDHLSKIAKGLSTYAYLPPPETSEEADQEREESAPPENQETLALETQVALVPEDSNTVYNCYLVPVENDIDFYNELDLQVADKFRLAVMSGNWDQFTFELGHKYHNDYALASKVQLVRSANHRKNPVKLSSSPSLKEVRRYLVDFEFSSRDAYYARRILKEDLRIRYIISPKKSFEGSLLSFLEGELLYNNKVYWRARNVWYEPMSTYVAESDKIFIEFLQQNYVDGQNTGHLMKGFTQVATPQQGERDCVRDYVQQYNGIRGYFLPDTSSRPLLFDLMYVNKEGKIWIYFIACNFMAHTSDLCVRISNCYEAIKAACEEQKGPLRSLYDGIEDSRRQTRLGDSFDEVQNRLKESKIVYALASSLTVAPGSLCSRTLSQEKNREVKITQAVLANHMEQLSEEELLPILGNCGVQNRNRAIQGTSRFVHEILQTEGYIDRADMVTAKFMYSTPNPFTWTYKLSRFQSAFKSLRARFELRYIAQRKVYSTSIHVMDIENQVQMEVE